MKYKEEFGNLFTEQHNGYALVECVSSDLAMGRGVALQFVNRFPKLREHADYEYAHDPFSDCIKIDDIYLLVTKKKYSDKPTYERLQSALVDLKEKLVESNCNKIAMPKIACGLDRLNWKRVSEMIQDTFKDMDVEILVKHLDRELGGIR